MKTQIKLFDDFCQLVEAHEKFLLISHEDPDGDSLGSLVALTEYLDGRGKETLSICKSEVPEIFNYLSGLPKLRQEFNLSDVEVTILLDNGDLKRTGFLEEVKEAKLGKIPIVNIDHHIRNDIWKIADINLADTAASSTSEIAYKLLIHCGANISISMATALLTGMYYDTGGFHHTNTTNEVLEISSELLHRGANLKKISNSVSRNRSVNMLKIWGIALDRIIVDEKKGIATTFLSREDIEKVGASDEEISGLVNLINTAQEVKVALLLYESSDGKIKGSLRTEDEDVDVAKIAGIMGGGGHKKASGFSINGKFVKKDNVWQIA